MKIALGTVQFGLPYGITNQKGQVSFHEAEAILNMALTNGVDTLDTAIAYGVSETRLGEIGVKQWKVVTKLPAAPESCRDVHSWVLAAVQDSLMRLKIDRLHGLLLHCPDQLLHDSGKALFQAMDALKTNHLVQKIGISIYGPKELDALCKHYPFDIVQMPFNVLDRRLIHSGWLSRLYAQETEIHVRSVFLQGLLLMQPEDRPRKFKRWQSLWEHWDAWLKEKAVSPLMACIQYAMSIPEISKVIVGVDSVNQLKEILQVAAGSISGVPDNLCCNDINLINPSCWNSL